MVSEVQMTSMLNPPRALNLKQAKDANLNWKKFKQEWQLYEIASGTNEKPEAVRLATFLHVAGPDALEKYNGFHFENETDKSSLGRVIEKFDADCKRTLNVLTERNKFFSRKQCSGETYDNFVTDLRILSVSCDFPDIDQALRDQFVLNIRDLKAKERLINEAQEDHKQLTFDKAISIAKAYEPLQEHTICPDIPDSERIAAIDQRLVINCRYCGRKHKPRQCPAFGKICSKCLKKNHFSVVCKSKNTYHKVNKTDSDANSKAEIVAENPEEEYV